MTADTPREGPTHTDTIDRLQAEARDAAGANLALLVRFFAGRYGEEMAREFITQGFASFYRDQQGGQ